MTEQPSKEAHLDQLLKVIETKRVVDGSASAFRSVARRIFRELDEVDIRSPHRMMYYRRQLPVGTRAVLGTVWRMLQETEAGADVPDLVRLPPVFLPHPLSASVMHLGAILGNEKLPEAFWGRSIYAYGWDQNATNAAWCVRRWFMGPEATADVESLLVVKDAAGRPMPLWLVNATINSIGWSRKNDRSSPKIDVAILLEETINLAFIAGAGAEELRWVCDRVAGMKPGAAREAKKALAKIEKASDKTMALLEWANELPAEEALGETTTQW